MVAAIAISFLIEHKRLRNQWPTLKQFVIFLVQGVAVFVLTMLLCWPMGVLQLGIAKGYLTLAYISVYRKTFSPFGTLDLWAAKITASPWEFSMLIIGVTAAFVLWRRFAHRAGLLPWLAYITVFMLITLKVTVPYTTTMSLAAAFAVTEWHWNIVGPLAGPLAIHPAAGYSKHGRNTVEFSEVLRQIHDAQPYHVATLQLLRNSRFAGRRPYLPYQLLPAALATRSWRPWVMTSATRSINSAEIASPQAVGSILCEEAFCAAIERQHPSLAEKSLLDPVGPWPTVLCGASSERRSLNHTRAGHEVMKYC